MEFENEKFMFESRSIIPLPPNYILKTQRLAHAY
jgi:hypothetical protein